MGIALKFTPLEFETRPLQPPSLRLCWLKFTPLEFETPEAEMLGREMAKLLKFTPLEFETLQDERRDGAFWR